MTLLRMRQRPNAGGLPFVKLSQHRVGYLRDDLLAFLAVRRVGAGTQSHMNQEMKGSDGPGPPAAA